MGGANSKSFAELCTGQVDPKPTIGSVYSVEERCFKFITESNALDGVTGINQHIKRLRQNQPEALLQGCVGAFQECLTLANARKPLGLNHIKEWHEKIVQEQKSCSERCVGGPPGSFGGPRLGWPQPCPGRLMERSGVAQSAIPAAVGNLLFEMNKRVAAIVASQQQGGTSTDRRLVVVTVETAADVIHGFSVLHPFLDATGRIARLIGLYVIIACGFPPPIFHVREAPTYTLGLRNPAAMRCLIASSLVDVVYSPRGGLLVRQSSRSRSEHIYHNHDNSKHTAVQWQALEDAATTWRALVYPHPVLPQHSFS